MPDFGAAVGIGGARTQLSGGSIAYLYDLETFQAQIQQYLPAYQEQLLRAGFALLTQDVVDGKGAFTYRSVDAGYMLRIVELEKGFLGVVLSELEITD